MSEKKDESGFNEFEFLSGDISSRAGCYCDGIKCGYDCNFHGDNKSIDRAIKKDATEAVPIL